MHRSLSSLLFLVIVMGCIIGIPSQSQDSTISDPVASSQTVFILCDFVDNFEHGLTAGGQSNGFGTTLAGLELLTGAGINESVAASLATTGDFGASDTVGFHKRFSQPIDAGAFAALTFLLRTQGSDIDVDVTVELVMRNLSRWQHSRRISGFPQYEKLSAPLTETAFRRVNSGLDGRFDLAGITELIVMFTSRELASSTVRTFFLDDILFVRSSTASHTVVVRAEPEIHVAISGTAAGTSPYSIPSLANGARLIATAPQQASTANTDYVFSHWRISGGTLETPGSTLSVDVFRDFQAVAVYDRKAVHVAVNSVPSGVEIFGAPAGVTDYVAAMPSGDRIELTAPPIFFDTGGNKFSFLRWRVNAADRALGLNRLTMDARNDVALTAVYGEGAVLTVTSIPFADVPIGGSHPGIGTYPVLGASDIQLVAPDSFTTSGGVTVQFRRWALITSVGIDSRSMGQETINFSLFGDTTAVAVYETAWTLTSGWNFVATPLETESTVGELFLGKISDPTVWLWDGERFEKVSAVDTLLPSFGYWIFNPSSDVFVVPGGSETAAPSMPTTMGWHAVGVSGFTVTNELPLPQPLSATWAWDNRLQQYLPFDSPVLPLYRQGLFLPGDGYWIYSR